MLDVQPGDTILDVGGASYTWAGTGLEANVTILNVRLPENCPDPFRWIAGDACDMSMFGDSAFDIVFSNSVIEHVGNISRQRRMADEVRRVGPKYWVQTPNRHFPIEVHFLFPFFQYLPSRVRIAIAKVWPFSFSKALGLDPVFEAEHIWLLTYRQMHALFPDALIHREMLLGLTKSLIAVEA